MKTNFKTILVLLVFVLALTALFWYSNNREEPLPENIDETQETGQGAIDEPSTPKLETQSIEESNTRYSIDVRYPKTNSYEKIDKEIKEYVDREVNNFKSIVSAMGNVRISSELLIVYEVKLQSNKQLSILFNSYSYTGGAHGNTRVQAFNFNLEEEALIAPSDLFEENSGYLEFLSSRSRSIFREKLGTAFFQEGVGPLESNFDNYILGNDSITFYFSPYEIAPYAAGTQTLEVPLEDLDRYLKG